MSNATCPKPRCTTCGGWQTLPGFHADGSDAPDFPCPDCTSEPKRCVPCGAQLPIDHVGLECEVCAAEWADYERRGSGATLDMATFEVDALASYGGGVRLELAS